MMSNPLALFALCGAPLALAVVPVAGLGRCAAGEPRVDAVVARGSSSAGRDEIDSLIALLDAPQFQMRDGATQRLAEKGPAIIPDLIVALGDPSAEVRFRASVLLGRCHSFEEVAPSLAGAVEAHYGPRARLILRERALQQLDDVCRQPFTEKLMKFWGTNVDAFCHQSMTRLNEAADLPRTRQAVAPLLGLARKTARFNEAMTRLEELSLSYDHQYSPGYVIADTLARGLASDHSPWIGFAEAYLESLRKLVASLRAQRVSNYALHKEVLDRANMSQGAAGFLVQLLDASSPLRPVLRERLGMTPDELQSAFCEGLAAVDSRACDRGVGKVHVVDMLLETAAVWKDAPRDGVVARLVAAVTDAAQAGDKPKALALLDALEACGQLPAHRLRADAGFGAQLADRLQQAALQAPNNRAFHPTQSVHNKLLALADLHITPEHPFFPQALWRDYLRGAESVTADEGRLALERYVRIVERLHAARADWDEPDVRRFVCAMRDGLPNQTELLAAGVSQLDQVLRAAGGDSAAPDARRIGDALGAWLADRPAARAIQPTSGH